MHLENIFPFETKLILIVGNLANYHQFVNILFETITYFAKVVTLNLPHVGKQQNNCRNLNLGLARLQAKREARESHHMLMGMKESVRE